MTFNPPFNYGSAIGTTSNVVNKQFELKSQIQPLDSNGNNSNFLPVYSNMPKSPSAQQGTINFKYSSSPPPVNQVPIDMTATFGGRNVSVIPPSTSF